MCGLSHFWRFYVKRFDRNLIVEYCKTPRTNKEISAHFKLEFISVVKILLQMTHADMIVVQKKTLQKGWCNVYTHKDYAGKVDFSNERRVEYTLDELPAHDPFGLCHAR